MIGLVRVSDPKMEAMHPFSGIRDVLLLRHPGYEHGLFLAESPKVIARALEAGIRPISSLVEEHWIEQTAWLHDMIREANPDACSYVADLETFRAVTGFKTARGMIALLERPAPRNPYELLDGAHSVAVLEDVGNYSNMGAIFRSAAALGIDAVLVTPSCHDPLYRRASRVSMGTVFQVPWARIGTEREWAAEGIPQLHEAGFAVVSLALRDDALDLGDPRLSALSKVAVVLGTEGEGLFASTVAASDYVARIPMDHGVDSLNVAAASSVAFWELVKRPRIVHG